MSEKTKLLLGIQIDICEIKTSGTGFEKIVFFKINKTSIKFHKPDSQKKLEEIMTKIAKELKSLLVFDQK